MGEKESYYTAEFSNDLNELAERAWPTSPEVAAAKNAASVLGSSVRQMIRSAATIADLEFASECWRHVSNLIHIVASLVQEKGDDASAVNAEALTYANLCVTRDLLYTEFCQAVFLGASQDRICTVNALCQMADEAIKDFNNEQEGEV